jgi:hypothetical protein
MKLMTSFALGLVLTAAQAQAAETVCYFANQQVPAGMNGVYRLTRGALQATVVVTEGNIVQQLRIDDNSLNIRVISDGPMDAAQHPALSYSKGSENFILICGVK